VRTAGARVQSPSWLLPAPSELALALGESRDELVRHSLVTLSETLLGFALSIAISIPLAAAVVHSTILRNTIYPILLAFQSVPKVAIAPLLVLWIGFGMLRKIVVVFLVCFFPIIVATATALSAVPAPLMELIRSLSASTMQTFIKIRVPTAMPYMFVGLKVAITLAVIGAVIGEFVGSEDGLGYLIPGVDLAVAHGAGVRSARVVDRDERRALLRNRVHRADRRTMGAEELIRIGDGPDNDGGPRLAVLCMNNPSRTFSASTHQSQNNRA
jgi:ABC-type nitrate/sulfonate/bicarbonate transport system permease component